MKPTRVATILFAALATGWTGYATDLETKLKTALMDRATPAATMAGPAAHGFRAPVQHTGFDLDLARLYRRAAPVAATADLPSDSAATARAPALATWDMSIAITPADRTLASALQRRAEQALAAQAAPTTATPRAR